MFHSATKYLAGHSDTIVGVAVTRDPAVAERLRFLQNAMGAVPGPFDCFLVLRGLRTLALARRAACRERAEVAALPRRTRRRRVGLLPGPRDGPHAHPQAAVRRARCGAAAGWSRSCPRAGGGDGARRARRAIAICEATRLFTLAESLGGVESLIELPAVMTHASVAGSRLEVPEALIRLSVGIEAAADLVADLATGPRPRLIASSAGTRLQWPGATELQPSNRAEC